MLSTSKKLIAIENGNLIIDNKVSIPIDQIEWYNQGTNFLFDGIRIKTIQKKSFYFSTMNFFRKEPNFKLFKDLLINKSIEYTIPEKTTKQLMVENKLLRYVANAGMILYVAIILLTIFTDFKIDKFKLFYCGMIFIGTFVSTRK